MAVGTVANSASFKVSTPSDREIVFVRTNLAARGLWRVQADGGEPTRFSQFDSATGERLQVGPRAAHGRFPETRPSRRPALFDHRADSADRHLGGRRGSAHGQDDLPGHRALLDLSLIHI